VTPGRRLRGPAGGGATHVVHHVVCQHRVEVEVRPARAEVAFQDERFANPADTQVRFEAVVYNAAMPHVLWEVWGPAGQPGLGSIDPTGVYRAPPKGGLPSGYTEVVVATAAEDRLRKASAWVTLVGEGPAPAPTPRIAIRPKRAHLYYRQGQHNAFIDPSNTMQLFQARLWDSPASMVEWSVDGVPAATTDEWFLFEPAAASGPGDELTVTARIQGQAVQDQAKVLLINYFWPGMP
jgi:hypothetical protein